MGTIVVVFVVDDNDDEYNDDEHLELWQLLNEFTFANDDDRLSSSSIAKYNCIYFRM